MKKLAITIMLFLVSSVCTAGSADLLGTVEKQIREDLTASISPKAELEGIRVVRGAELFGPSAAGYKVRNVYMDGYSGKKRAIYAAYLQDASGRNANAVIEASYDINEEVYMTARPIGRGETLSKDDYYIIRQKSSKLPTGAITSRAELENKILKNPVAEGVILRSSYFAAGATVKKGQRINLMVETDNLTIAAQGVLKRDAIIGQAANVQCDLNKKEVSGILVSATEVRVKL